MSKEVRQVIVTTIDLLRRACENANKKGGKCQPGIVNLHFGLFPKDRKSHGICALTNARSVAAGNRQKESFAFFTQQRLSLLSSYSCTNFAFIKAPNPMTKMHFTGYSANHNVLSCFRL